MDDRCDQIFERPPGGSTYYQWLMLLPHELSLQLHVPESPLVPDSWRVGTKFDHCPSSAPPPCIYQVIPHLTRRCNSKKIYRIISSIRYTLSPLRRVWAEGAVVVVVSATGPEF